MARKMGRGDRVVPAGRDGERPPPRAAGANACSISSRLDSRWNGLRIGVSPTSQTRHRSCGATFVAWLIAAHEGGLVADLARPVARAGAVRHPAVERHPDEADVHAVEVLREGGTHERGDPRVAGPHHRLGEVAGAVVVTHGCFLPPIGMSGRPGERIALRAGSPTLRGQFVNRLSDGPGGRTALRIRPPPALRARGTPDGCTPARRLRRGIRSCRRCRATGSGC